LLDVRGNALFNAEDAFWGFDAVTSPRLGFVKKSGSPPIIGVGSATAFSIAHSSGTDINTPSTQTYTTRFHITSGGNVGIGTTSPSDQLHVMESSASAAAATGASVAQFERAGNAAITISTADAGDSSVFFGDTASSIPGRVVYSHSTDALYFGTNGITERARIDSSGRFLIGTSTSVTTLLGAGLQVHGTGALAYVNSGRWSDNTAFSEYIFSKSRGASVGTRAIVQSGDGLGGIQFTGDDGTSFVSAASITAAVDGTPGANDMPGRLVFSTTADGADSPTERMRINNAGAVFVGGSTSIASIESGAQDGKVFKFGTHEASSGATITTQAFHFSFANPNGFVGSISTSGSATAYNTSSDYRLKENVIPLTGAADRLNQLQVHRFNFIADPDKIVDGFIAHEAQAVVPECVTGTKDEVDDDGNPVYQGIDQSKLVPLLTAALQEAIGRIETLEAKVAALEAQ
jgi:hypothetical protein